eukprot:TRINITY_DN511_c0_g2_i1.p1 TRINITY_DN511_c0_g2~~TRINITY_DN511_c0_g2_i1.p1  ORF type:complete len:347 (+),score=52.50 TRINITY_DN511_c0_g2_i1:67-1107(+)
MADRKVIVGCAICLSILVAYILADRLSTGIVSLKSSLVTPEKLATELTALGTCLTQRFTYEIASLKNPNSSLSPSPPCFVSAADSSNANIETLKLKLAEAEKQITTVSSSCQHDVDYWRNQFTQAQLGGGQVQARGQILQDQPFCQRMYDMGKQSDVNFVLEIGTWFGGGSSLCWARGLKDSGNPSKVLYTIEIFEECWLQARKTLATYPVRCILGGTVPIAGYLKPEEIPKHDDHYHLYYERDLKLAAYYEPMLEPLCKNHKFDVVFMDGNEYTGWAEFQIVRDICKPKYLLLHDVGTLKTVNVSAWLVAETGGRSAGWERTATGSWGGSTWESWINTKWTPRTD